MAAIVSANAAALEWTVNGQVGGQYESNPERIDKADETDLNPIDADWRRNAEIGGSISMDTGKIHLDGEYSARHESWRDDSFENRNTLTGFGTFSWRPAHFFEYFITDRRTDLIIDSEDADVSSNRDVRNVFVTGASFYARLSSVDDLVLTTSYRSVHYQRGEGSDGVRPAAELSWEHRLSEVSRLSVNGFYERITYFDADVTIDTEFSPPLPPRVIEEDVKANRGNLFFRYEAELRRLSYELEAGATRMDVVEGGGEDYTAPLFRGALNYEYAGHLLNFRLFHVLTDSGIGLAESTVGGADFDPGDANVDSLDILTRQELAARYNLTFGARRWNFLVDYSYNREDWENLPNDQNRRFLRSELNYDITRWFNLGVMADNQRYHFIEDPDNRKDNRLRYGLTGNFRLFRHGYIDFGVMRETQNSNVDGGDYSTRIAFINFRMLYP